MDDLVKAMARTFSDRVEVEKRFRLSEKASRNVFELLLICIQSELKGMKQVLD